MAVNVVQWTDRLYDQIVCHDHGIDAIRLKNNGRIIRIDPQDSKLCECLQEKQPNTLAKKLNEGKE